MDEKELQNQLLKLQEQLKLKEESEKALNEKLALEQKASAALKAKEHERILNEAKKIRDNVTSEMTDEYLRSIIDLAAYMKEKQTVPLNAPPVPPSEAPKPKLNDYRMFI